jgi:hypothetical protein
MMADIQFKIPASVRRFAFPAAVCLKLLQGSELDLRAAESVTLAWDPSPPGDYTILGYKIYSGPASHTFDKVTDCGNVDTVTLNYFLNGKTYFFVATCYARMSDGRVLESDWSNEVSYTVPGQTGPGAPSKMRVFEAMRPKHDRINEYARMVRYYGRPKHIAPIPPPGSGAGQGIAATAGMSRKDFCKLTLPPPYQPRGALAALEAKRPAKSKHSREKYFPG